MTRKLWIMALGVTLASSLLVAAAGPGNAPVPSVITAIDYDTGQILLDDGTTVQVIMYYTVITMKGEPIEFGDLAVDMTVRVCGKMVDGVLVADKINVMYNGK
jgi:hypothetical protein